MSYISITEAAKVTGKSRPTIYRHIKEGRLSTAATHSGEQQIDTSELLRVYGEFKNQPSKAVNNENDSLHLREELERAASREEWLKKRIETLEEENAREREHSRELERLMLPPGAKNSIFARLFGR